MNDKKYKILILMVTALLVITVSLFAIQNFLLNKTDNSAVLNNSVNDETITIYRATEDIPAYTMVMPNMFERITIPKIEDIGFITDISTIANKHSRSYIFKGNFLTESSITNVDFEAGLGYNIEIKTDLTGNLKYGDIADVYAVSDDGSVIQLFTSKKLYAPLEQKENSITRVFINVSRNELMTYYSMMYAYKIAIVPVDPNQVAPLPESTN